jgi:hypothetical protein
MNLQNVDTYKKKHNGTLLAYNVQHTYLNLNSNYNWDVAKTILFFSHNLELAFLSYNIQLN